MAKKKSKAPLKLPTRHLLSGIATNIALGPLGFRAELDVNPEDKNPMPSRIVFCERESEAREPSASATSVPVVTIDDIEQLGSTGGDTGHIGQEEEGKPRAASIVPELDHESAVPVAPIVLTSGATEPSNGFGSLGALLQSISAIYINHEESGAIRNKVEVTLSRVTSLDALFWKPPDNVVDRRRRNKLICKVRGIEGKLRSLYESLRLQRPDGQVQGSEDMFILLEDLYEAIFEYQMARQTTTGDQGFKSMDPAEAVALNCFRFARQAEHRHGDRNGCLRETRGEILDGIELWTYDSQKPSVYWLNGLAGTGKSTIAQTIAERTFSNGRLGASFFCSRDFEDRSNLKSIFPTLAVQLARNYSEFRSIFVPLVQSDPEIVHESLYGQMNKLIVQPLVESAISTVIVIDALDECKDEEPASAILSVLGQFVAEVPKVKFFITGRPEPRIREGFRLPLLVQATDVFVLHEVEPSRINSDIRLFFEHKFSDLKGRRGLDGWPTGEQLDLLCERTGGLFVHAVATIRFIDQRNANPKKQLDRLLRSPDSRFEGKTKLKVNTTLDSLYITILQEAFGDDDPENDYRVRSVLGAVVLAINPLSPTTISTLLGFETEDVFPLLSSLHSLLILREDVDRPVQPFHKSFPDFIIDPARCINQRFRVHPPDQHAELLVGCLEIMNRRLGQNMCKLPDGVTNSEVADLRERTERHISQPLQYACQSWHKHLIDTIPAQSSNIVPVLRRFLEEKFLFWLEALSILGTAREAVDALKAAEKWLDIWKLADPAPSLVKDYFRFVITFFEVINTSAPHIYHSALFLSPRQSTVRKLYERYARPLARVVHGLSFSWEPIVATFAHRDIGQGFAWSPCTRLIAISISEVYSTSISIVDAVTLKQLNIIESPRHPPFKDRWLSFSPDGRLLTQFSAKEITSWDLQTGGPVDPIPCVDVFASVEGFSCTYSMDGKVIAVACDGTPVAGSSIGSTTTTTIVTYNLLSRTHVFSYPVKKVIPPIWTHGEYIRFATAEPGSIRIWEIAFNSMNTPGEVDSLLIPDEIPSSENLSFLPTLSRLALALPKKISVWDAQNSKLLLDFTVRDKFMGMSFSPDGCFFTCSTSRELHVWKESPIGYEPHQNLVLKTLGEPPFVFFSPNEESIAMVHGPSMSLWPTGYPIIPPYDIPDQPVRRGGSLPAFSPDETLVAVRPGENRVVILGLESGDSRLAIDVGMKIGCVRMTGSMVVVASCEKVVAWDIPARDSALNFRANMNDSVHATTLGDSVRPPMPLEPSSVIHTSISSDLNYVAIIKDIELFSRHLDIYDTWTGRCLTRTTALGAPVLYFTPDRREIWSTGPPRARQDANTPVVGWTIIEEGQPRLIKLERLEPSTRPLGTFPWESPCGYEVADSGWVLSPTQKRLIWLPHHWWPHQGDRVWQGRFFGFLHGEPPETVILEFLE